jgi:hypothetical protein
MKLTALAVVLGTACLWSLPPDARGAMIRGKGTLFLRGGDLTDPENDGLPDADSGYNATFASSEEPGFGGGESAFNVFDNQAAGGNAKWCCGDQNSFPANSIWINATFPTPQVLRSFTVTSGNDTPARDPRVWQILGSNDGSTFTPIFTQNDPNTSLWTDRDQVLEFTEGIDFPVQTQAYSTLRFETTATGATTGARFQVDEIEYFNDVPEPSGLVASLGGLLGLGLSRRSRGAA